MTASSAVTKRSLTVAGHRTSISLEDAFWAGLRVIAARRGMSPAALVSEIDRGRGGANLSSAIRVFVLDRLHADVADAADPASISREGPSIPTATGS